MDWVGLRALCVSVVKLKDGSFTRAVPSDPHLDPPPRGRAIAYQATRPIDTLRSSAQPLRLLR